MQEVQDHRVEPMPGARAAGLSIYALLVAALAAAAFLLAFDLLGNRHHYRDIDDVLRAIQIGQLLAHGDWFDLVIKGIDMPGVYLSPWSRLVDLPYVVLALALGGMTTETSAVWWAFRLWQPLLLIAFCSLWCATALRLAGTENHVRPLHVVAAFAMMPLTLWEFSPGRIDHHNLQIVVLMLALFGIVRWSALGGFIAGLACGLSFIIGLELAPVFAIVLLAPGLAWVLRVEGSGGVQLFLAAGLAITTAGAGLLFSGPALMASTQCDVFSAPFATAFLGYAAITSFVPWAVRSESSFIRLAALAIPAAGLVAALALAFPDCLQGPYRAIDPLVREFWLDRVQQENSFLEFYRMGEGIKIVCLGLLVAVMLGALPILRRRLLQRDVAFVTVFCVAAALLLLTFVQIRFIRFPSACVLLFLPLVWDEVKRGARSTTRALVIGAAGVLVGGLALTKVVPYQPFQPELLDYLALDLCTDVDTSPLHALSPGRIVAPPSLGLYMLDHLPPGMTINAVSFHRAAPGMRRMFDIFVSTDSEIRRKAAEPFDYLAVCRYPLVPEIPNNTVFATLARGGSWPGLTALTDPAATGLRLFRIDHVSFE
ncbi:MAG: hypothetical protein KUL88_11330 [Rhizobium sp.]|nr:hypothetical protein [Rhizobium sp.]